MSFFDFAQRSNNDTNQMKLVLCVHRHTLAAPLAEEEAAAGPGAGGAEVLSKSSSAPGTKGEQVGHVDELLERHEGEFYQHKRYN